MEKGLKTMSSTGVDSVLSEMISKQSEAYRTKLFEEVEHWLFVQGRSSATTYINKTDLHPTEKNYPEQTKMFREILDEMYKTHLDKNQDYSPYNINATGMIGIVTRFWDKTARIMNLFGFDIATGTFNSSKGEPKNEPIEDSFIDSANYSVIALIFRAGKWGR